MVNVRSIAEMGAYVSLLEYNNIEGMILLSELSRRRIRSINKLIRIGRNECVVVIRVDKEKGEGSHEGINLKCGTTAEMRPPKETVIIVAWSFQPSLTCSVEIPLTTTIWGGAKNNCTWI